MYSARFLSWERPLYARASSTDSPSGSRISIASSAFARAESPSPGVPVEPGHDLRAAAEGRPVAQRGPLGDRPLDRVERVVEPVDGVRGARQFLERGRPLGRGESVEEDGRASVMGVGLAVRVECRRPSGSDERVLGDDVLGAGGFGVVDDVGGVGVRGQQGLEDLGVEAAPRGGRDARPDRIARELVAEAHVARVDLEQRPTLRLLRGRLPAGHDNVQHGDVHPRGHDRDQLQQPARVVVEPRGTADDSVRDRGRQLGRRSGGEQLGDVEGIPAGGGVQLARAVAGERGDGALRKGRELDHDGVAGADGADGRMQRMARRRLAGAEGEDEQRRQRADPPPEHRDRVERRIVRPVHVLEHEHGRRGRQLELRDQQRLDVVRGRADGERLDEGRRNVPNEVAERAQRARNREVVAGTEQHSRVVVQILEEPGDERCLADPGLAGDEDDPTGATGCRSSRLGERGQRPISLEELHQSTINPVRPGRTQSRGRSRPRETGAFRPFVRCTLEAEGCIVAAMIRFIVRTAITLAGSAVGLLVAGALLDGVDIDAGSFILAVVIFTISVALLTPFLANQLRRSNSSALGGVALIATLAGLIITDLIADGFSIDGVGTWLAAMVIVWVASLAAVFILPYLGLKKYLEER